MKSDFELILEECLAQMRSGKTLEECLSTHPDQAKKLRPLLQAAAHVWEIPIPRARPEAVQAGRERLLAGANRRNLSPSPVSPGKFARYTKRALGAFQIILFGQKRTSLSLAFRMAAILAIALLATGGITVNVSARSLPGDKLYGVKRTWESVRLSLTPNQQGRQQLQQRFAAERREEIQQLIQLRRAETVEFEAPLEGIDAEHWQVDGFQVHVDSGTEVEGDPETGLELYIRARLLEDGTLTAIQVRVPGPQPTPYPTSAPAPGLTPKIDEDPETEGTETHQYPQEPGETPRPTKVKSAEAEKEEDTVKPTQEPEQDATQTPKPHWTRTPEPTEQHEKEGTPEPTETQKPTQSPEATEKPHKTPEPTDES
jgi:hypothetical protein